MSAERGFHPDWHNGRFPGSESIPLTDAEFRKLQRFIYDAAGITMADAKKAMVSARLSKRLFACDVDSYAAYIKLLSDPGAHAEVQTAIDLLTTNETYFFRESRHFDALRQSFLQAVAARNVSFRVWSAASSSGEEAYSAAMTLAHAAPTAPWEVLGTDISSQVLQKARWGHYPDSRAKHIPPELLRHYCLRGTGEYAGSFLVDPALRARVRFAQVNLNAPLPSLGQFDAIFLRNVMIYFSIETRRQVIERVADLLRPRGQLYIGLSESLNGVTTLLKPIAPSIYVKS